MMTLISKFQVSSFVWTQLCSVTIISNNGAHEPSWLKSIVKFSFQKGAHLKRFQGVVTPEVCKKFVS